MANLENHSNGGNDSDDALIDFQLPMDKLPGKDLLSKMILKTKVVMDLVASELLDIGDGNYVNAGTEWHNGSRSDVLYVSRDGILNSLPPILIEVQLTVNEAFMHKLVQYSQSALQLYRSYPVVVVFCIDKVCSTVINKFKPVHDKPWMHASASTDYWAKSCFLLSQRTLSCGENDNNVTPLRALSAFLIEQSPTLYGHSLPGHPTIRLLYRLSKDYIVLDQDKQCDVTDAIDVICSNNERILRKAEDSLHNVPGTSKTKKIISTALELNRSAKRKYVTDEELDFSLEPLPSCSHTKNVHVDITE
ncbi:MAG: hypothetical protein EXX96DRAFT_562020 [Benjaminiella poitrasii]|nr:MAG: hypothetical protein EXX96DRAFT_562020 [Benjaminiella poitrasii]